MPTANKREREVWGVLWRKPQAVAWEHLGLAYEVAMYVRRFVEAEQPGSSTTVGTLVRQLGEALGLTIPGMARNRWKIGSVEKPPTARPATTGKRSAKDRLKVVDGGAA